MTDRHHEQLSTRVVSSIVTLTRYLVDKSMQSRKIVQWCFLDPILREARSLFVNATDMLDGMDSMNKALRNVYNIQKQSILVSFLERDNRKKIVDGKRKKHYGFDYLACSYIDELCDDIISQICAYGRSHQPHNKGYDG